MKKFTTFETQLGESVVLTDKAKLSLYKKSSNSGIAVDILEEVYRRGFAIWGEQFGGTPDSFAFDRVNSFIAGGFAAQLDEDLLDEKRGLWDNIHAKRKRIKAGSGERMRKPGSKGAPTDAAIRASQNEDTDPCWKGYKQIGMKTKGGRKVPNCVPVKEQSTPSVEQIAKKHDVTVASVKSAVAAGRKVEKEHTKSTKQAEKIARDHLGERPDYYKRLQKMEKTKIIKEMDTSRMPFSKNIEDRRPTTGQDWQSRILKAGSYVSGAIGDIKNATIGPDKPDMNLGKKAEPLNTGRPATPAKEGSTGDGRKEYGRFEDDPRSGEGYRTQTPGSWSKYTDSIAAQGSSGRGTPSPVTPGSKGGSITTPKPPEPKLEPEDVWQGGFNAKSKKMNEERLNRIAELKASLYEFLESYEQIDEAIRIVDPVRKKLDPKHGEKGTFQGDMERWHLARAAKDRRALTHGKGVAGFNTKIDPSKNPERYKNRDQDAERVKAVKEQFELEEKTSDRKRKAVQMILGRKHKGEEGWNEKINPAIAALRLGRKLQKKGVNEATYQGKTVPLNKPMKGDVKKSKVYVDPDGDGKAQKVNFGDKNMSIKKDQPGRKKSYCARSGGIKGTSDKTSANYWSRKAWNCSEETVDEAWSTAPRTPLPSTDLRKGYQPPTPEQSAKIKDIIKNMKVPGPKGESQEEKEARMKRNYNRQRAAVGLPPVEEGTLVREDAEKHSKNPKNPASRFDGSKELTAIYKKDTPGQDTK